MRPNKIFCIGDIHIFNAKRFNEHKYVFNQFYNKIDDEKPELIVIAGDLLDSKARLSPEQIDICRDFLLNLADRATVIMIPGNHDTNLANADRLDSLTPIVYSLLSETNFPIFYFNHSNIYDVMDINWAVWSCIDDQKSPFKDNVKPDGYTIGLYHGVVSGAVNDDNFKLSGGIDINEFKDCDIVMMADIHKQQSFRNGEINYTGSFIQVTVTESADGSFLIYDYNGKGYDVRVERIKNIYSTVSIDVNADIKSLDMLPTQKVRIQYDTDKTARTDVAELSKQINSSLNVPVIISPKIKKKDTSVLKDLYVKDDAIKANNINDYFKDFVKKGKEKLDIVDYDKDLKKLLLLEAEFSKGEVKEFEVGDFFIHKMILNNFLSFGPQDNVIDFSNKDGIVGIVGKNRVGKSSIIKAIQFGLFYEMPNNSSAIKMINKFNRSEPGTVTLYLTKAGDNFRIKRTLIPDKKKKNVSVELLFEKIDASGTLIDNLTKESRVYTETEIRKYLGLNETFEMLSLFSAQKRQTEFIDCKNADRLKLVNKFLGLQSFEMKEDAVKKRITEKNAVFNLLAKQFDVDMDIKMLESNLNKTNVILKIALNDDENIKSELEELDEIYKDVISLYNANLKIASKQIAEPVKIKNDIAVYESYIVNIDKQKEDLKEDIKNLENRLQNDINLFESSHGIHPADYNSDYTVINDKKVELGIAKHQLDVFQKQILIDTCNTCGKDFTEDDRNKVISNIDVLKDKIDKINNDIKELEHIIHIQKLEINNLETLSDQLDNMSNAQLLGLDNTQKDYQIKISNLNLQIGEYDKMIESIKIVDLLEDKVKEYNNLVNDLSAQFEKNKFDINMYKNKLNEYDNRIKQQKEKKLVLDELEDEIRILKAYRKIVSKDGLPLYILKNKIDDINEQINLVVSQVFPFIIDFSVDDDKGELKIQFHYDGDPEKNDVALASGSETFIINLCIKVALSQISNLPKIDSVFIDEGYDSLDKDTLEKIPALFGVLTNYYKNVITISHLDDLKDMCQYQILLEKTGKFTVIR